jgi:hypothetical protein
MPPTPPLYIHDHSVCSNTQAVAIYKKELTKAAHRITYNFVPHSVEGFETYVIASSGSPEAPTFNTSQIITIGCDGGFSNTCTPTIKAIADEANATRGAPVKMEVGGNYSIEVTFSGPGSSGVVTLTIGNNTNNQILSTLSAKSGFASMSRWFGLLVGRGGGAASCSSDFTIQRA